MTKFSSTLNHIYVSIIERVNRRSKIAKCTETISTHWEVYLWPSDLARRFKMAQNVPKHTFCETLEIR